MGNVIVPLAQPNNNKSLTQSQAIDPATTSKTNGHLMRNLFFNTLLSSAMIFSSTANSYELPVQLPAKDTQKVMVLVD